MKYGHTMSSVIFESKKLAKTSRPGWSVWPRRLTNMTYRFQSIKLPRGKALRVGERLHESLEDCVSGRWVHPEYYYPCLAILHALSELGMKMDTLQSEMAVSGAGCNGRMDIYGVLSDGRSCVVEIKSTLGKYLNRPSPQELIQLGYYATLSGSKTPRLACLRISFPSRRLGVYCMDVSATMMKQIRASID